MDLFQTIAERKSRRAFLPREVPKEEILDLLSWAGKAPSANNIQPWEFVVITGKERERLVKRIFRAHQERNITCSPGTSRPLPEPWRERPREVASGMKAVLQEGPLDLNTLVNEGSCRFYEAPAAVLVLLDDLFPSSRRLCLGMALGYFFLAAEAKGLGTCPIGLITAYEGEIKEQLNIPESKQVVLGIALGYPDPSAPINRFKSTREDMGRMVRWVS